MALIEASRLAPFHELLREVERLEGKPGASGTLSEELVVGKVSFRHFTIVKRFKSKTSPVLLSMSGSETAQKKSRFLLKNEDVRPEWAAMGLMSQLLRYWRDAGRKRCMLINYKIWPIGTCAGLIEFVENAITMDSLKREAHQERTSEQLRALTYLDESTLKVENLAFSTAAYLASNYILGVCDGHGENIMLTKDGCLFRVDFDHLFGNYSAVPLLQVPFDMPIVWLPGSVVYALKAADMWQFMLEEAERLVRDVLHARSEFWFDILAAATAIDKLWDYGAAEYLVSLTVDKFRDALGNVEGSMVRGLKSSLHFRFGHANRPERPISPARDAPEITENDAVVLESLSCILGGIVGRRGAMALLLEHPSLIVRRSALDRLAKSHDSYSLRVTLLPELVGLFYDEDHHIKTQAIRLVGTVGANAADHAASVADLFEDEDTAVVKLALRALAQIGSCSAGCLNAVAALHEHRDVSVRAKAALVMAELSLMSAAEDDTLGPWLLSRFMEDECPEVQIAALHGFSRLGAELVPQSSKATIEDRLSAVDAGVRSAAAAALAQCWPQRVPAIADLLDDESASVRCAAAIVLSQCEELEEDIVHKVAGLLADTNCEVRAAAADAVSRISDTSDAHVAALTALLEDDSPRVRSSATTALARMSVFDGDVSFAAGELELADQLHGLRATGSSTSRGQSPPGNIVDEMHLPVVADPSVDPDSGSPIPSGSGSSASESPMPTLGGADDDSGPLALKHIIKARRELPMAEVWSRSDVG